MKKLIKNKKDFMKGLIIGSVLFIGIASLAAYAYTANEVTYTPSDTSWNVSDVKSALDDLYIKSNAYLVTGVSNDNNYGTVTSGSVIYYGGTTTLTITPSSGYYLSAFSCTNSYTYSGVSTGRSYTSSQTVTISNNNQTSNTTCTATFQDASCTVTRSGSNGFSADYNCVNGTGTMTTCRYSGPAGSATCAYTYQCTLSESSADLPNLNSYCDSSLFGNLHGGGLDWTISCSC